MRPRPLRQEVSRGREESPRVIAQEAEIGEWRGAGIRRECRHRRRGDRGWSTCCGLSRHRTEWAGARRQLRGEVLGQANSGAPLPSALRDRPVALDEAAQCANVGEWHWGARECPPDHVQGPVWRQGWEQAHGHCPTPRTRTECRQWWRGWRESS